MYTCTECIIEGNIVTTTGGYFLGLGLNGLQPPTSNNYVCQLKQSLALDRGALILL